LLGLINKVAFKSAIFNDLLGRDVDVEDGDVAPKDESKPRLHVGDSSFDYMTALMLSKGFYHYIKTTDRLLEKSNAEVMEVGIVYLLGTISGESGEWVMILLALIH
jgi:hypothetical protein